MIEITNVTVSNIENAIRGMRNPLNSWDKSDSYYHIGWNNYATFKIGETDKKLAINLIKAGSDHSKFMRQIFVSMDINAPLYWWKEMDTYKVSTTANSCSTMHTIHKNPITIDMFSIDKKEEDEPFIRMLINHLERTRQSYLSCKENGYEDKAKEHWRYLIQLLPSSFNQMRTWTASFQTLRNIYFARKNHKLTEWHDFCKTIEELPYSELITIK